MLYKTNNECFSFVQWCEYVHSLKAGMFHSTHEHIRTIALINIHYVYTIHPQTMLYLLNIQYTFNLIDIFRFCVSFLAFALHSKKKTIKKALYVKDSDSGNINISSLN